MARYGSTKINKTTNRNNTSTKKAGSLVYNTTIYNDVPERDDDIYITTQPGDRLDNLAMTFYGSSTHWWFIAHVNNLDKINVETGTKLRIPSTLNQAQGK